LLAGNELYVVNDLGIVSCLDAVTGTLHWQQRIGGNHSASPVLAAGRIYFLSEEGVATVIAPGKTFQRLATNQLDGAALASIAVFNKSIFLRTASHLYRLGGR
jgi:outer membrane protein assembly factor BamB